MYTKNVKHTLQNISVIALIIVLLLASCTFVSCKKSEIQYDEAEVLSEAKRLLESCEIVNSIFYGNGISYVYGQNQNGVYCEADYIHLHSLGLYSLTDMKNLCLDTYSSGIANMIFSATTDVENDGAGNYVIARYYMPTDEPDRLMVNTNYKQIFDDRMTYDYSTLKVVGTEGDKIKLTITASVMSTDESKTEPQTMEIKVLLVEESDGYRIDNFVFANYNEALE